MYAKMGSLYKRQGIERKNLINVRESLVTSHKLSERDRATPQSDKKEYYYNGEAHSKVVLRKEERISVL